jgi:UDP-glucose 4-epimerase
VKLLVTGGAGYIGGIVTTMLLEAGHEVTVVDDLSTGGRDGVPAGAAFAECGLHDIGSVLDPSYDAVLHFAGLIAAGESMARPGRYWHVNTGGSLALLVAMRHAGVHRLVFSSTAAVYGDPETVPIPETARLEPTNVYGDTKLAVDLMLAGSPWLAAVSLRYFNVVGSYEGQGERHTPETHLIPLALEAALGTRPEIAVFGTDYPTPDGTAIRDYIHVEDLARAHLLALGALEPGTHKVYNLGNGTGFSVREVLSTVEKVTGRTLPVVERPRRAGDPVELVASSARARDELGWVPRKASLEQMVSDAWDFARR